MIVRRLLRAVQGKPAIDHCTPHLWIDAAIGVFAIVTEAGTRAHRDPDS